MTQRHDNAADPAAGVDTALGFIDRVCSENRMPENVLAELKQAVAQHAIFAVTDPGGVILEANSRFVEISKYSHAELIGAPQNIVNSGRHSPDFWEEMWRTIRHGKVWQGEICNRAKDGSEYWVSTTIVPVLGDDGRIQRYISLRTETTELHTAESKMRELAYTDSLTGLANRTALLEVLDSEARRSTQEYRSFVTVALSDLPALNQAFGFVEGDRLLIHTAERLSGMWPQPHTVSRIDSATFGIIICGLGTDYELAKQQATEIATQIIEEVGTTMRLGLGFSIDPSVRVGYVIFRASDNMSGSEVYQRAEIARHRIHDTSRSVVPSAYRPKMYAETQARIKLVLELRQAIVHDQLRLFLQPIVNCEAATVGYECLIRWQHPELGLVLPNDFIPLAEKSGLIIDLGLWVLNEACRILGNWAKDPKNAHLTLAVNVSERQLHPRTFPAAVKDLLEKHSAPASQLKLEVTESMIHDDLDLSVQVLSDIRDQQVDIALDDFGTGYSSLSYLVKLPVNQLKIDRSFVLPITESESGSAIVQAIVELAHVMGLQVVAEGVETEAQYEILLRLGVDRFQGFLFGKPDRAEDVQLRA